MGPPEGDDQSQNQDIHQNSAAWNRRHKLIQIGSFFGGFVCPLLWWFAAITPCVIGRMVMQDNVERAFWAANVIMGGLFLAAVIVLS